MIAPVHVPIGARALAELDDAGRRHLVATWRELDSRAQASRAFSVFAGVLVAVGVWLAAGLLPALPLGVGTTLALRAVTTQRKVHSFRRAARELGLDDPEARFASRRLARVDLLTFPDDERLISFLHS